MKTPAVTAKIQLPELARRLGWRPERLYRLVRRREIPHFKVGRDLFFDEAEIAAWLEAQHRAAIAAMGAAAPRRTREDECREFGVEPDHEFS